MTAEPGADAGEEEAFLLGRSLSLRLRGLANGAISKLWCWREGARKGEERCSLQARISFFERLSCPHQQSFFFPSCYAHGRRPCKPAELLEPPLARSYAPLLPTPAPPADTYSARMRTPLRQRKVDLLFFVFLVIHIPATLLVGAFVLSPPRFLC